MSSTFSLPASRTEVVLEEIRRGILTRELKPGQPLIEAELAARLGVSKTPVREALKVLSNSGLVTFSPYKGASVCVVDAELAKSVYDVRMVLEPEAVRRSVDRRSPELLEDAAEALKEASAAIADKDQAALSLLNRRFHRALYSGCGNPLMVSMLDDLRDRAALISVVGWEANPSWRKEWSEHKAVLAAAKKGDAEGAAELLRAHIGDFLGRVLESIGE
ncbi:GntR family transcriptional regulator [Amycolatopsis regifaucium]|uniref:GntR family transcriptional regulator n=1 Tax=Amycolatopsis regifaucium TaxID=546365 RepID=A0A154M621_9PSEU|nr:GntR family transcriptional regulator [Amycolatopsis regifaucium]KZB80058.1 GntR family transcriptional regulator [Amycolatopsis regifaucium]OKA09572.1 GntR family transcriptional regulator [Amycolatopsis regifaucium]SFH65431.1 DNA-binding transcriptional regulator, GntR family [Amycolatopsis regifaucium]